MVKLRLPLKLNAWFWAVRPFSLSASTTPILVGSSVASSVTSLNVILFMLCLTGSIAIQIGTNLTDEYADHKKSGGSGKFLAPHKVIQRGLLTEKEVLIGIIIVFFYGSIAGLIITYFAGLPILIIGVLSVAVAYLYAGGPKPLGHMGLGEIIVFMFMGPVMVMATYYVQVQSISLLALTTSVPVGCIVTAILHCNNMRDTEEDFASGKMSLAILLGNPISKFVYSLLIISAFITIAILSYSSSGTWSMLGLITVPIGVQAIIKMFKAQNRSDMNQLMVISARLHAWMGYTFSLGLALS